MVGKICWMSLWRKKSIDMSHVAIKQLCRRSRSRHATASTGFTVISSFLYRKDSLIFVKYQDHMGNINVSVDSMSITRKDILGRKRLIMCLVQWHEFS